MTNDKPATGGHIKRLTVEDFKRVHAVEITADDHVVVGGENDAGKSSIFDAVEAAFGGRRAIPKDPIRHGAESAQITVEIDGDMPLTVSLRVTDKGSTITVANPDGSKHPRAQEVLNTFYNAISFSPEAFQNASPPERADMLCKAAGIDLTEAEAEIARMYDVRTERNRELKLLVAQVEVGKMEDHDAPEALVDIVALAKKQTAIYEEESVRASAVRAARSAEYTDEQARLAVTRRHAAVEEATQLCENNAKEFAKAVEKADAHRDPEDIANDIGRIQAEMESLAARRQQLMTEELAAKKAQQVAELAGNEKHRAGQALVATQETSSDTEAQRDGTRAELEAALAKVKSQPTQEEMVSAIQTINTDIEAGTVANAAYEAAASHRKLKADMDVAAGKATTADEAVTAARKVKADLLAAINIPIDGLKLTMDGDVLINGVPFDGGSESGRIETSIAIGMALNPKLKTMLVRQASLIGPAKFKRMCETARAAGYDLWFERVGEDQFTTVVIEEGTVRAP